ncbi:hypothetical protein H7R52_05800 [Weissella confusa]|uniref:Uncharacterized protein n=1 Tax=Weissella confusa TaxID=1583 RepID=A0A923SSW7_WEICO|nr:hypothetical protein [Weissella confusa]
MLIAYVIGWWLMYSNKFQDGLKVAMVALGLGLVFFLFFLTIRRADWISYMMNVNPQLVGVAFELPGGTVVFDREDLAQLHYEPNYNRKVPTSYFMPGDLDAVKFDKQLKKALFVQPIFSEGHVIERDVLGRPYLADDEPWINEFIGDGEGNLYLHLYLKTRDAIKDDRELIALEDEIARLSFDEDATSKLDDSADYGTDDLDYINQDVRNTNLVRLLGYFSAATEPDEKEYLLGESWNFVAVVVLVTLALLAVPALGRRGLLPTVILIVLALIVGRIIPVSATTRQKAKIRVYEKERALVR